MFFKRACFIICGFIFMAGIVVGQPDSMVKTISPEDLKKLLDKNDVFLVDVREPAEHRSKCIEGSVLIPLSEVSCDKISSSCKCIVVYCQSGRRSAHACLKLLQQDSSLNVVSLEGGILGWEQAGFYVKKNGSNMLPVDRQTQFAAGFLAFSGTMLGTFVSPWFYVIPGFVGMGLMFAGISGWCGMALLLAKMPWNR